MIFLIELTNDNTKSLLLKDLHLPLGVGLSPNLILGCLLVHKNVDILIGRSLKKITVNGIRYHLHRVQHYQECIHSDAIRPIQEIGSDDHLSRSRLTCLRTGDNFILARFSS